MFNLLNMIALISDNCSFVMLAMLPASALDAKAGYFNRIAEITSAWRTRSLAQKTESLLSLPQSDTAGNDNR